MECDKSYLLELEAKGVPVSPLKLIKKGESFSLSKLFAETTWEEAIVKPAISGAGRNTFLVHRTGNQMVESQLGQLALDSDFLFQRFETEIMTEGEISLIFFEKEFSHAVKKTAKSGEFRVQDDHGGKVSPWKASPDEIEFGLWCLSLAPRPPLYARVDILKKNSGQMVLMELELIEPELFFRFSEGAPDHFAKCLLNRLS